MTIPRRLALFEAWAYSPPTLFGYAATRDPDTWVITTSAFNLNAGATKRFSTRKWLVDGTVVATDVVTSMPAVSSNNSGVRNLNSVIDDGHWYSADAGGVAVVGNAVTREPPTSQSSIYQSEWIFGARHSSGSIKIERWNAPGGVPGDYSGVSVDTGIDATAQEVGFGTDDDGGYIWFHHPSGTAPFTKTLIKYDLDLNVIHQWSVAEINACDLGEMLTGNFFVYKNLICFQINPLVAIHNLVALVKVNEDFTLENYGTWMLSDESTGIHFTVSIGGCLGMDQAGTFSLCDERPIVWQSQ